MNYFNIERAFRTKKERGWDKIYIAIDFHDTIFKGYYQTDQKFEFYPNAQAVLKWFTQREDIVLIAYTCSYAKDFEKVNKWLNEYDINFTYLNENPECPDTDLAEFDKKFYFNIMLDDKASGDGFKNGAWVMIAKLLEDITGEKIVEWDYDLKKQLLRYIDSEIIGLESLYPNL